jgi:eukaryotic translation initiation factor 2C
MSKHISDLTGMMKERVIAWYNKTKGDKALKTQAWKSRLPDHILFYRDGVSESQYGMVLHEEKPQILDGCAQAFTELKKSKGNGIVSKDKWKPNLTLLVVTKRHHARFFPMKDFEGKKYVKDNEKGDINLKSGLVVDTVVIDPIQRDFYLQSHHSALGTGRSGHYIVIHDDNEYDLQELQQIVCCSTRTRSSYANIHLDVQPVLHQCPSHQGSLSLHSSTLRRSPV